MKIAIIDDQEAARYLLRNFFEDNGHDVIEAKDGVDGLNLIENNPDLKVVILDLVMPRMDGLTMAEELQKKGLDDIPILMATTEADQESKSRGKAAGINAWLTKPYNLDVLLEAVHTVSGE